MLKIIKPRSEDKDSIIKIGFPSSIAQVVVEDNQRIGLLWGDYCYDNDKMYYLEIITTETPRKGYGVKIISQIFNQFNVDAIFGESTIEAKDFWIKIGADVDKDFVNEDRDVFEFILSKKNFSDYISKNNKEV